MNLCEEFRILQRGFWFPDEPDGHVRASVVYDVATDLSVMRDECISLFHPQRHVLADIGRCDLVGVLLPYTQIGAPFRYISKVCRYLAVLENERRPPP